jgi:hypothetical protein
MTIFSRRQFLQLAGIGLLGSQISPARLFYAPMPNLPLVQMGRTLAAAPIYSAPVAQNPIIEHLWPDSVVPIQESQGAWYKLPQGYALKTALQPMALYETPAQIEKPIFWGEVAGPVAPVRQWCAANAPLITRIGHGGVAQIIDYLPGESTSWYGVAAENGDLLGWSQATHWRRVTSENTNATPFELEINQQNQTLIVYEDRSAVLSAPISTGQFLNPGTYPLQSGKMSSSLNGEFHGVPWQIRLGEDYRLNGVYWHNDFGAETCSTPGPAVQVMPMLARWLYHHLSDKGFVTIV